MSDGDVILFPKARDDSVAPPVERELKPRGWEPKACAHKRTTLNQSAHQLRCRDCDAVLDPFDWMWEFMGRWEYENTRYKQAQQQARQLAERVEELKRAETNAKARARKAGVHLTSAQARAIRDQFRALSYLLGWASSIVGRDKMKRRAKLAQWDEKVAYPALKVIEDQLDLRAEPDEGGAA